MPKTAERPGNCRAFRFTSGLRSALLTALLVGLVLPALLLAALAGLLAALLTALVLLAALLLLLVLLVGVWIVHGRLLSVDFARSNRRPCPSFRCVK